MKFAHIADTHIRNLKYHKEYRAVFAQLYKKLKEEKSLAAAVAGPARTRALWARTSGSRRTRRTLSLSA